MARQPARQQASQPRKKRRLGRTMLWGLLGLIILLAGAASVLYYMNRERIQTDNRLRVVRDFVDRLDTTVDRSRSTIEDTLRRGRDVAQRLSREREDAMGESVPRAPSAMGGAYTVREGESLWTIAEGGRLVDNPWEWRRILVDNQDKIDYAFVSRENGGWKVIMAEGQQLTVTGDDPFQMTQPVPEGYAVQLVSLPGTAYGRGVFVVRVLVGDGYWAYLYRTEAAGQTVYRVRSGFYESEARAREVGREIQARYADRNWFTGELWVMQPSPAERRGERMDFGVQRVRPWVVELSSHDTHGNALAELRRLAPNGEFAYIAQDREQGTQRFRYHTRVGYFVTEADAQQYIDDHAGAPWEDARPTMVDYFEEAFPGQHLRLRAQGR